MIKKIRKATAIELSTPIETIKISLVDSYKKRIQCQNLNEKGKSTSFGSMDLPIGIIVSNYHNEDKVDIHEGWRKILWNAYRLEQDEIKIVA